MRQFDVCKLRPVRGGKSPGLIVIVQADLLSDLDTRIVAPLSLASENALISQLRVKVQFGGKNYLVLTDRMGSVARKDIGTVVGSLKPDEWKIQRALNVVFVGV